MKTLAILMMLATVLASSADAQEATGRRLAFRGLEVSRSRGDLDALAREAGWRHQPDGRHTYVIDDRVLGHLGAEIRIYVDDEESADTLVVDRIIIESDRVDTSEWKTLLPRMMKIREDLTRAYGIPHLLRSQEQLLANVAPGIGNFSSKTTVGVALAGWKFDEGTVALTLRHNDASAWIAVDIAGPPDSPFVPHGGH